MYSFIHYKITTRTVISKPELWTALSTLLTIRVAMKHYFQMTWKDIALSKQGRSGGSEWMKPANKLYLPPPSPITASDTWYSPDTMQDAITGMWSGWMLFLHFHELCEACVLIPLPNLSWKQWVNKEDYESMCWLACRVHSVHIWALWII